MKLTLLVANDDGYRARGETKITKPDPPNDGRRVCDPGASMIGKSRREADGRRCSHPCGVILQRCCLDKAGFRAYSF